MSEYEVEKLDDKKEDLPDKRTSTIEIANREKTNIYKDFRAVNIYKFLGDAYTGKGGFSGNTEADNCTGELPYCYIIPNPTENFYLTRIKNSVYINYFKKFINAPIKPVFSSGVTTTIETEAGKVLDDHPFGNFLDNITGGGVSSNEFLSRQMLPASYRDAVSFAVMDKKDGQPYVYMKQAYEVADNGTDEKGNLTWILFSEAPKIIDDKEILVQRYWGLDYFRKLESEDDGDTWKVVEEQLNELGILPVYPMLTSDSDTGDYLPHPGSSYAIASIGATLYNRWSTMLWVLEKQAHSRLVYNGQMNGVAEGITNAMGIAEADTNLFQPFLLSPDPKIIEVHNTIIEALKNEMFELMEENGVSVNVLEGPESGMSKAYSFSATNDAYKFTIKQSQGFYSWAYGTYRIYQEEESADYIAITEFPKNMQPKPALTVAEYMEIADYFERRGMKVSLAEVDRALMKLLKPNAPKASLEDIIEEINNKITENNE